jgi:hypothetical protein
VRERWLSLVLSLLLRAKTVVVAIKDIRHHAHYQMPLLWKALLSVQVNMPFL